MKGVSRRAVWWWEIWTHQSSGTVGGLSGPQVHQGSTRYTQHICYTSLHVSSSRCGITPSPLCFSPLWLPQNCIFTRNHHSKKSECHSDKLTLHALLARSFRYDLAKSAVSLKGHSTHVCSQVTDITAWTCGVWLDMGSCHILSLFFCTYHHLKSALSGALTWLISCY